MEASAGRLGFVMERVMGEVGGRLALERVLERGETRKNIPGREDSRWRTRWLWHAVCGHLEAPGPTGVQGK